MWLDHVFDFFVCWCLPSHVGSGDASGSSVALRLLSLFLCERKLVAVPKQLLWSWIARGTDWLTKRSMVRIPTGLTPLIAEYRWGRWSYKDPQEIPRIPQFEKRKEMVMMSVHPQKLLPTYSPTPLFVSSHHSYPIRSVYLKLDPNMTSAHMLLLHILVVIRTYKSPCWTLKLFNIVCFVSHIRHWFLSIRWTTHCILSE